jgi:hypothetical protein
LSVQELVGRVMELYRGQHTAALFRDCYAEDVLFEDPGQSGRQAPMPGIP